MKHKVGDKVRIKPKNYFCSVDGFKNIHMKDEFFNQYSRLPYCETVMTIGIVNKDFYVLKEDRWAYKWTDDMFEDEIEALQMILPMEISDDSEQITLKIPEGYEFAEATNGKIILNKTHRQ